MGEELAQHFAHVAEVDLLQRLLDPKQANHPHPGPDPPHLYPCCPQHDQFEHDSGSMGEGLLQKLPCLLQHHYVLLASQDLAGGVGQEQLVGALGGHLHQREPGPHQLGKHLGSVHLR